LRPGSKKFWLLASLGALLCVAAGFSPAAPGAREKSRANELTLAGLRPGQDKLEAPQKIFRSLERDEAATDALVWGDICTHRDLRIEMDSEHLIRTVTVSSFYKPENAAKCAAIVMAPERLRELKSGHGLLLGDACSRVVEIYGKPDSESPSVKGSDKLELYFYSFGWAGSDVPQVMEISCNRATYQVVEMILAASSL